MTLKSVSSQGTTVLSNAGQFSPQIHGSVQS